ncbi:MAG: MobA/MobL family protein [Defluviitaleaceae bacterium]|nr:MobA/MobL family protein [Defluviitaleaceae bacterium]
MAIFHMNIQIITRGKGKSAVAAAAYRAGERITNERDGYTSDYTKKKGIVHTEIFLPNHAPIKYKDRAALWNAVEKIETNSNAQLAREIEFSLPVELSIEQNISLVHEYVQKYFVAHGMIADVCVHDTGKGNPHAHVMLIMRPLEHDGTWGAKSRKEYILDKNGERIKLPSGEWKSRKIYTVDWNDKTKAEEWRKGWADTVNATFEKFSMPTRIDHRSFERQGNGLIPTIHLGVAAHQMEQKGIRTEKGNYNRHAESINSEIKQTKARIRKMKNWLYAQPLHNTPSFIEIMGKISDGKNLKSNWQRVKNLQKSAKVLTFLTENKIASVEDFSDTVVRTHERLKIVTDEIKKTDRRLDTLAIHLAHNENINTHRAIYQKYKNLTPKKDTAALNSLNPFTRNKAAKDYEAATQKHEAFYEKHADAIDAYKASQQHFAAVMNGRTKLPISYWQKEQNELAAKRYKLCDEYYALKEKIPNMEAIRRSVENLMREDVQELQRTRAHEKSL